MDHTPTDIKHIDSFVVVYKYSWMWWGIERGVVCDRVKGSHNGAQAMCV